MVKLVECVPNFSEGRDKEKIEAIVKEIKETKDVALLNVDAGAATNRTVVTFVGTPQGVREAAFRAIARAVELIDMRAHKGAHARMGATDVCPFIPVSGVTMEECAAISCEVGRRVADELDIPVYLYEYSATSPGRKNLADIRQGEYEGLEVKLRDPLWAPDFGAARFNPKSGATVIGAREFLIAYNINLNTRNTKLAKEIGLNIREKGRFLRDESGRKVRDEHGHAMRIPGRLEYCKATGWFIEEFGRAQVTMNLTNYKITPPHAAFDEVCSQAEELGVRVTGSELVGLIPLEALTMAGQYYLRKQGLCTGATEKELIRVAVLSMGLNDLYEFKPEDKIIEYRIKDRQRDLVDLSVSDFMDELSSDSPAPGGGSTAALAGSLGAALCSMVANLTFGKKDYASEVREMENIALKAQTLKKDFLNYIDSDSRAFNELVAAMKLPKKGDENIKIRETAVLEASKKATLVPFEVLKKSTDVLELILLVATRGFKNSISDAGVAGLMCYAAAEGAYYNVMINLGSITNADFVFKVSKESAEAIKKVKEISEAIKKHVTAELDKNFK